MSVYKVALVGAGRMGDADRVLAALEHRANGSGTNAMMTRDVGLPLCRGLKAFGAGRFGEAIEHLLPLRPIAHRFGGSHAQRDVLTLTLMPSFANGWLVPRLPRFLAAHPQLELNLQSSIELVDFARDGALDAGLRYGPGHWPGLDAVHLFDDWIAPTASPELIARLGKPSLRTLGEYPLLGAPGGRWSDWFIQFGGVMPKRFVANFDDTEALHRAASEGLGIALGRLTMARPLIDAGRLQPLFPQRLKSDYAHYLVFPPRSREHAGLAAFRAWLLEEARAYALELAAPVAADTPQPKRRKR